MKNRIITALIGLPVFLFLLYQGGYFTSTLVFIMIITATKELLAILKIKDPHIFALLSFFSLLLFIKPDSISMLNIFVVFLVSSWLVVIINFSNEAEKNKQSFITMIQSIFIYGYVTIPMYHLVLLRELDRGFIYLLFMFLIIWATDSFAYFVGRSFGKNKMAPLISPKKTIEGAFGGSFCALLLAFAMNVRYEIFTVPPGFLVAIVILMLTIISQIGDLFESCLKRIYKVKDSGKILPGHGGVLDRFDSTIFVAPIFYIVIKFL